jgi:mercuric ion transport protein
MRTFKAQLLSIPGLVLSVLPVGGCPACWPVYAGVLSALGLTFLLSKEYLMPLTALFLLLAVATLALKRHRGYAPFAVGVLAAAIVLAGKFAIESDPVTYAGVALLVLVSLWNAWPRRAAPHCPNCAPLASGLVQVSAPGKTS